MSDTPKTDEETNHYGGLQRVSADFARQLERELSEYKNARDAFVRELDGNGCVVTAMVNLGHLKSDLQMAEMYILELRRWADETVANGSVFSEPPLRDCTSNPNFQTGGTL